MVSPRTSWGHVLLVLLSAAAVAVAHVTDDPVHMQQHENCGHQRFSDKFSEAELTQVNPGVVSRSQLAAKTEGAKFKTLAYGDGFQGLRINFDATLLTSDAEACTSTTGTYQDLDGNTKQCTSDDILTSTKRSFITNTLVPEASAWFKSVTKVDPVVGPLQWKLSSSTCAGFPVPQSWKDGVPNSDFNIILAARPTGGSTIAYASFCALLINNRPAFGIINFDPSKVDVSSGARQVQIGTMKHEMMHALVFSSNLYSRFLDKNGNAHNEVTKKTTATDGHAITLLTTPAVTAAAREHFGCSSLQGLEIENGGGDGSAGSHWEQRLVFSELMAAQATGNDLISTKLSLAIFEDSGWYLPDYSKAEIMQWGKAKGCSFATDKCSVGWPRTGDVPYFCTDAASEKCDVERRGWGLCNLATYTSALPSHYQYFTDATKGGRSQFMDYCPHHQAYSNRKCAYSSPPSSASAYGEQWGVSNSRCFESSLIQNGFAARSAAASCHEFRCLGSSLQVKIGSSYANCVDGKATASGYSGSLTCPPASEMGCGVSSATPVSTAASTPTPATTPTPTPLPGFPSSTSTPTPTPTPTPASATPTGNPVCGNGIVEKFEECDDSGTTSGDGCTSTCKVEQGYQCVGAPSRCSQTSTATRMYWTMLLTKPASEIDPTSFLVELAGVLLVDQSQLGFVSLTATGARLMEVDLTEVAVKAGVVQTDKSVSLTIKQVAKTKLTFYINSGTKTADTLSTELSAKLESGANPISSKYGVVGASSAKGIVPVDRCSSVQCSTGLTCIDGACKGTFDDGGVSNETWYLYVALIAVALALVLVVLFLLVRYCRNKDQKKQQAARKAAYAKSRAAHAHRAALGGHAAPVAPPPAKRRHHAPKAAPQAVVIAVPEPQPQPKPATPSEEEVTTDGISIDAGTEDVSTAGDASTEDVSEDSSSKEVSSESSSSAEESSESSEDEEVSSSESS